MFAPTSATVHVDSLRRIVATARELGVDPGDLGQRAGLGPIPDGDTRLPVAQLYALWRAAQECTGTPGLSVKVANASKIDEMGLFGFAVMTAPRGLDALQLAARLFPLVTDSGRWTVDVDARAVTARWARPPARDDGHCLSNEAVLGHFVACTRQLLGPDVRLGRVSLGHTLDAGQAAALSAFFDCKVEHGDGGDALHFVRDNLGGAPQLANPAMHAFLRGQAEQALASLHRPVDLVERVRDEIRRRLAAGDAGMDPVGRALGMAPRTLRRQLTGRGVAFQQLIDDVRKEEARSMLEDPRRSVTDVALDLGFAEASAFTRAYRRWYGVPPSRGRGGADEGRRG